MFVYIDEDEWYPVYSMRPEREGNWGERVEISTIEYERYERVMTAFREFQVRMLALKKEVKP